MALPGLLIEYLFNGSIALTWLYPVVGKYFDSLPAILLPFVIVALYIAGMVIDVVAWALTGPVKHWIRRPVHHKYRGNEDVKAASGTMRLAKIGFHAPELAKEISMRSSRDRIARGAIVNAVLSAIFVLPWWLGLPVVAASIIMWGVFEKLSYMYELCAEKVVDDQLLMKVNH